MEEKRDTRRISKVSIWNIVIPRYQTDIPFHKMNSATIRPRDHRHVTWNARVAYSVDNLEFYWADRIRSLFMLICKLTLTAKAFTCCGRWTIDWSFRVLVPEQLLNKRANFRVTEEVDQVKMFVESPEEWRDARPVTNLKLWRYGGERRIWTIETLGLGFNKGGQVGRLRPNPCNEFIVQFLLLSGAHKAIGAFIESCGNFLCSISPSGRPKLIGTIEHRWNFKKKYLPANFGRSNKIAQYCAYDYPIWLPLVFLLVLHILGLDDNYLGPFLRRAWGPGRIEQRNKDCHLTESRYVALWNSKVLFWMKNRLVIWKDQEASKEHLRG